MARTRFDSDAANDLGERLQALRGKAGEPSYERIGRDLERYWGITFSMEQIRKAHVGLMDPHVAQLDLLAGLASFYEVEPDALGPVSSARLQSVLVTLGGGPDGHSDKVVRPSKWNWGAFPVQMSLVFPSVPMQDARQQARHLRTVLGKPVLTTAACHQRAA